MNKKKIAMAIIVILVCLTATIIYITFFMDNKLQAMYRKQNNAFGVNSNTKISMASINIQEVSTRIRIYNESENEQLADEEVFTYLSNESDEVGDDVIKSQPANISKYIRWYNSFWPNGKRIVKKNHDRVYKIVAAYKIQNELFAIDKDVAEICYINTFNSADYVDLSMLEIMLHVYNNDCSTDPSDKISVDEVLNYLEDEYDADGELKILNFPEKFEKYKTWYLSSSLDGDGKINTYYNSILLEEATKN